MPDDLCPWEAPILLAAASGHTAELKEYLENGDEVDARDAEYGRSCLAWAVVNGHGDAVRLLLQHSADPDAPDVGGRTPLLHAIATREEDTVRLLLDVGARVDQADFQGRSPLIAAAQRGCSESLVTMLLQAGADPDARDWRYGGTAVSWAARQGYEGIVRVLLERNAAVDVGDECQRTPIAWAARKGHADIVNLLLERDACLGVQDSDGQTPFEAAFEAGHDGLVQLLRGKSIKEIHDELAARPPAAKLADLRTFFKTVTPGFDLNDPRDGEVLIWAIRNEREEDAILLIEQGADVNHQDENGMTALAWAASHGQVGVAEALIEAGADSDPVDGDGWTPLMLAAEKDHSEVVRILLGKNVNVNRKNEEDMTALLCASCESVVALLLDAGADPNDADLNGRTPISYAAERGDESSVMLLLERGAMIDDGQESSPLMEAISQHDMAFVKLLLEKGADPYSDEYSCCEYPPLRHAADHGQVEIARLLLEKDAVSAETKKDHILRAIDSACEAGHDYMVELLMSQYPFGCTDDEDLRQELQGVTDEVAERYGYDLLADMIPARVNRLHMGSFNAQ